EKDQYDADPAECQHSRSARSINGSEAHACGRKRVKAPGEQPNHVKEPEPHERHRVVVPRISKIEKPEYVFVDEIEPEETMILAGAAVERKVKRRRIPQRRQYEPGHSNRTHDEKR